MKTDREETYVVKTHWGTFRLDARSYKDYLEGRSWISYMPGKRQAEKAESEVPPGIPEEVSELALKFRFFAAKKDVYNKCRQAFPVIRPVIPYKERMRQLSIDEMPLMTRSANCLMRAGAHNFGRVNDILELEQGLKAIRNLGAVSEEDILHCFVNACYARLTDAEKARFWQEMIDRSGDRSLWIDNK